MKTTKISLSKSLNTPHTNTAAIDRGNKLNTSDNNLDLKILLVSWNMMGKLPSQKTLEALLPAERTLTDLIVIGKK